MGCVFLARYLIGVRDMPEALSSTNIGREGRALRLTTYNVHACRGVDGRLKPERVLGVIRQTRPEIVALQELDGLACAEYLAEELEMELFFVAARPRQRGEGSYGNALLTRLPALLIRAASLPRLHATTEARAAQWIRVATPFGPLDVLNTHLGLLRDETTLQAEALLGPDWLSADQISPYAVLCGDFNARPSSPAYRRLSARLLDAQLAAGRPQPTFPAIFPLIRIDHVFLMKTLCASRVEVPSSPSARVASDHRPLSVELTPAEELRP
jgi:endonuclease/exonuclease/phosphatase family metal-dependent hydrolase